MEIILTINNDELLSEDAANRLIEFNKVNKLFIDKNKKYLNLYAALIKKSDFHINTKNSFLKRTPYIIDKEHLILNYLEKLPVKYREQQYRILRETISNYYLSGRLDFQIFNKWFKNNRFPLVLYRVLAYILDDDKILIKALSKNYITDVSAFRTVKLPFLAKELFSKFNFYLAGVVMGDGNINEQRLKIVDGDRNIENLHYSKKFLSKIREKVKLYYHLNPSKPYRIKKKAYELIIANKWFCRYLNFFFSIQIGKKSTLILPKICNLINKNSYKSYVVRGLFDTDGSITGYRATILSIFPELIKDIERYLNSLGIKTVYSEMKDKKHRMRFRLNVLAEDLKKFAYIIGISHSRKQLLLTKYLKKNSLEKKLFGYSHIELKRFKKIKDSSVNIPRKINKNILKIAHYIRPVKNAGKIRFCSLNNIDLQRKIFTTFKNIFRCKIKRNNKAFYVYSKEIELFFSTFFYYDYLRTAIGDKEANKLIIDWNRCLN